MTSQGRLSEEDSDEVVCPYCGSDKKVVAYRKSDYPEILIGLHDQSSMLRCQECHALYLDYYPSREELANLYNQYFTYPETYSRNTIESYKKRLGQLDKYTDKRKGVLLEVGCAGGNWLTAATELGWQVEGNDLNVEMLERLREKYSVPLHHGFFEDLDLQNGKYDVVIAMNVFEHLVKPQEFINKLSEVLKPRGLFMIKTPLAYSLAERFEGGAWQHLSELGHIQFGSKKSFEKIISKNHYEVMQYNNVGFPPMLLSKGITSNRDSAPAASLTDQNNNCAPSKKLSFKRRVRSVLSNINFIKGFYFGLLQIFNMGDSSYWILRRKP